MQKNLLLVSYFSTIEFDKFDYRIVVFNRSIFNTVLAHFHSKIMPTIPGQGHLTTKFIRIPSRDKYFKILFLLIH